MTGMAPPRAAMLLPYAESFGPDAAGAVSLDVRDVVALSRHRERICVFGRPVARSFPGVGFTSLEPAGRPFLGRNLGLAEALRRRIGAGPPTLVEVQNRPNMFHYLARRAPRLPLALRLANDPLTMRQGRSRRHRRRILDRALAVLAISRFVADRFLDGTEDGAEKLHVIHIGIRRTLERPPQKEPLILYVGRIVPEKGVGHLVEALERVLPRHPGWRAVIIGASHPGAVERTDFEARLLERAAPLAPQLRSVGFLPHDEVLDYYRRAAVVVVPSTCDEALARVGIEGLAHGCAVIGYASGGIPEVVGGRGLVLHDRTPRGLEGALESLLADDDRRRALQAAAWDDYPFTLESSVAAHDELRERLLSGLAERRRDT